MHLFELNGNSFKTLIANICICFAVRVDGKFFRNSICDCLCILDYITYWDNFITILMFSASYSCENMQMNLLLVVVKICK